MKVVNLTGFTVYIYIYIYIYIYARVCDMSWVLANSVTKRHVSQSAANFVQQLGDCQLLCYMA